MKRPNNYKPEYSLSISILSTFLSAKQMKELLDKYVRAKQDNWKDKIKGK